MPIDMGGMKELKLKMTSNMQMLKRLPHKMDRQTDEWPATWMDEHIHSTANVRCYSKWIKNVNFHTKKAETIKQKLTCLFLSFQE